MHKSPSSTPQSQRLKCLTLRQPYAAAVVLGLRLAEPREGSTDYRGPLLIHAGAGRPSLVGLRDYPQISPEWLVPNQILGVVDLVGCVRRGSEYLWVLSNPRPLAAPFPCRGRKGLWDAPQGVELP
jgi:hypothetical protein